jgi:hypothetical protein
VPPQCLPRRFPASCWLLLASPRRVLSAQAALHRRSPSLHPAPPTASWRPHVLLPSRLRRSSPRCPLLCVPRHPRLCPNHTVAAMHAAGCQLWLPRDPVLIETPNTSWSFLRACSCICTPYSRSISPAPTPTLHRTSSTVPAHRRQPPPPLPIPDPKHQQHYRDPPQLTERTNLSSLHQNCRTTSPTSPFLRRRSASHRPAGTGPLHLDQRHQQHHIIPLKRSRSSFTALRCPSP